MKWYYTIAGGHTHVRVFMNGAKCGDLCFRNEEFVKLLAMERCHDLNRGVSTIEFINETPPE
jgi:hypothetical protein